MSKAYSNKALPPGTVLREWRLEDVLGVGGFGIVYRGRGIYFDELVAIKEYFPSSISERDAEDTVVPIDSDAEEVHALGLKKFVEEAKLLWNLSTPTRHPNIVNVRSLFEVHGTAYMVMDFEDGNSLSRLLKQGTRFNERSLLDMIRPIAEGLDRAHRVGVLHRDIKPPNILINPDGRPVLIDFGSARFEAAEATSTSVTFHTPPYAAIEQYVKTYPQGPWTDIYALGVVLYECVAGEKPPEVLERLHGEQGRPLAEGHWPGYSPRFLAAIDSAMTIRPDDRPRSIAAWLEQFDSDPKKRKASTIVEIDDDATRIVSYDKMAEAITPVAPPEVNFEPGEKIETQVPDHPSEVEFKRAGHDTNASNKAKLAKVIAASKQPKGTTSPEPTVAPVVPLAVKDAEQEPLYRGREKPKVPASPPAAKRRSPLLIGGGIAALVVAAAGGWAFMSGGSGKGPDSGAIASSAGNASASGPSTSATVETLAATTNSLANDARTAGAPGAAVDRLAAAGDELGKQFAALRALSGDPTKAAEAKSAAEGMKQLAFSTDVEFANALLSDSETKARRLTNGNASEVQAALDGVRLAAKAAAAATDPGQALAAARDALVQSQAFAAALGSAAHRQAVNDRADVELAKAAKAAAAAKAQRTAVTTIAPVVVPVAPVATVAPTPAGSAAKIRQLQSIVDDGRAMAAQVIRKGTPENVQLARGYDRYLNSLRDSSRGVRSDRDADRMIGQAKQTRAYLQYLVKQTAASR
ncbi:serine/threonine protein kinase [Sphingomonas sp. RB1R13]|uniref:serine/threonine protein kinase n=1 Tax=Sphingomonas sp. RB1R13 TaxID=3096159 RepID=UPI002FCB015F